MDYKIGKYRGFGFVEYDDADDAAEAIFNMDGADLMGRTLKVSMAQPNQLNKLAKGSGGALPVSQQAIWSNDEWFQQHVMGAGEESSEVQKQVQADQDALRD